jgi:hypothetical protein
LLQRSIWMLERISRRLQDAPQGRDGVLAVEGPAAMSTTALLTAVRQTAERDGFRVLPARGAEVEREFAFGALRQLIERPLAQASLTESSSLLEGPAQLAMRLLAIPGAEATGEAEPVAPHPSFAVLHGLYRLCANMATKRPVLLVVDDAHCADASSLRFLA